MSTGGIVLLVYLGGTLLALIPTGRFLARMEPPDDAGDIAMIAGLALVLAPMWPLLVPGAWVYHVLKMDAADRDREHQ